MKSNTYIALAVFAFVVALAASGSSSDRVPIEGPIEAARIEVHKKDRLLKLYSADQLIRQFSIGLGFNPKRPKHREGDGATPEGLYSICVKNPRSKYFLSLGISYPNPADAERGMDSGLISKEQYRDIIEAHKRGIRPPWNTGLGGEIFIHGSGSSADWTWGCIALDNGDMLELYNAVRIGTKVEIKP